MKIKKNRWHNKNLEDISEDAYSLYEQEIKDKDFNEKEYFDTVRESLKTLSELCEVVSDMTVKSDHK